MTDTSSTAGASAGVPSQGSYPESQSTYTGYPPEPSGWTGWVVFGGMMMFMLGSFHIIQGLVALFNDEFYLVGKEGMVLKLDFTQWGWIQILFGAVVVLAGLGLLRGQTWARIVAVLLALGSAIVNLGFLGAYPIWGSLMIALDVLVIYSVTAHGSELKSL